MKKTFMSWLGAAAVVAFVLIPVTAAEQAEKEQQACDVLECPVVSEVVTEAPTETTAAITTTTVVTTTVATSVEEEEVETEEYEEDSYTDDYVEEETYEDYSYSDNYSDDTSTREASYSGERNISDYEYNLLVNLTSSEYGANWVSTDEKSKIAATVLNIADNYYGGDITEAIYNSCVPYGFDPSYDYYKDDSIYDAVDNVINNEEVWSDWTATSWCGDGVANYFT